MFLDYLKREENKTYTENGALTNKSTQSHCLDLFATIGALRGAGESEIADRFLRAYAEDPDLAMKTLFFARDVRGGLGERRVFRTILSWLSVHEPASVRRNLPYVAEFGRYDDLLSLMETPCEGDVMALIREQLDKDREALQANGEVSLLAKWLPSVNASNKETVKNAKKIAAALGMNDATYRKTLTALRARIKIIENNLREKDYTFDYAKQPSKALFRYRQAFLRNDAARYLDFMNKAQEHPAMLNTGTLTPYDVIAPVLDSERHEISEEERRAMDVTWKALEDFACADNSLAVVDGSGSMYWEAINPMPAAVAQSLGIYFAERNKGAFHGHFITFSENPQLVEVKGRDIVEKVRYCMSFNECANTNLAKTFDLILNTAVKNRVSREEMPEKLYVISDMEFDCCAEDSEMTNFEYAKKKFAKHGYRLPQIVFWNVASRYRQQPVTKNEQGAILVSGCSPQIFSLVTNYDVPDPYAYMVEVLSSRRYEKIVA